MELVVEESAQARSAGRASRISDSLRLQILYLLAEGVDPADIVDADVTACLLYPQGFNTRARRGSEAVEIRVAVNEKRECTVMAAVTMGGGKLPLFTVVQGKTLRAERGLELDPHGPHASTHSPTGWMTVEAMLEWLKFLRNLPEFRHGRAIHLILDGYATHPCEAVWALAARLSIVLHLIPPGLTDLLQPLDRSVFGTLKAEH
jgi:hypothetical protein